MKTGAGGSLLNLELGTGWRVVAKVKPKPNSTGGNFSTCYNVEKQGKIAFLKA